MAIKNAEDGCSLCFSTYAENSNPVMYCRVCNVGVHARCYGENHIDDIDKLWTCMKCKHNK